LKKKTPFYFDEGFTENLPPEKLVESIDYYFENLINMDLEKLKLLVILYVCWWNTFSTRNHAYKINTFDIIDFVEQSKNRLAED
jgi:hypothetical protein